MQEFVVQHDEAANPPTFFLTLESLMDKIDKNKDLEVHIRFKIVGKCDDWDSDFRYCPYNVMF